MKTDSILTQLRQKYGRSRSLKASEQKRKRGGKRSRVSGRHSTFESLELRRLLAAEVGLAANTLVVTDQTASNDDLSIEIVGTNYVIANNSPLTVVGLTDSDTNPNTVTVSTDSIDGIHIRASGGDDSITLKNIGDTSIAIDGGDGNDTLTGPSADSSWTINEANAGYVAGVSFTNMENLTGAANNEDIFTFTAMGSLSGIVEGGDGGFDVIAATTGGFDSLIYTYTGPQSGSIDRDGNVITYDGFEPVVPGGPLDGSASDITFNFVDGDHNIELSHVAGTSGATNTYRLKSLDSSPTFEQTDFFVNESVNSITVNLGSGDDIFRIGDMGPGASVLDRFTVNADSAAASTADTIVGPSGTATWDVDASDTGTVNDLNFTGFDVLQGGDSNNTIAFTPGSGTPAISFRGGSGTDTLTIDANGNTVTSSNGSVTVGSFAAVAFDSAINTVAVTDWLLNPTQESSLLDGLSQLTTFGGNLTQLPRFDTPIPLANNGSDGSESQMEFGDVANPGDAFQNLETQLVASSFDSTPTSTALQGFLSGFSTGLSTVTDLMISDSGGQSFDIDLQFEFSDTATIALNNQEILAAQGLAFPGDASFDITTSMDFDLAIAIDNSFAVEFTNNEIVVDIVDSTVNLGGQDANIGALGTTIESVTDFDFDAELTISFGNLGSVGNPLLLSKLQDVNTKVAADDRADLNDIASVSANGTVNAEFDVKAKSDLFNNFSIASDSATVQLGDSTLDIFTDLPNGTPVFVGSDLVPFTRVTADDLLAPLEPLSDWLGAVSTNGLFDASIPLVDLQLGDLLDFSGALDRGLTNQLREQSRITGLVPPQTSNGSSQFDLSDNATFTLHYNNQDYTITLGTSDQASLVDLVSEINLAIAALTAPDDAPATRVRAELVEPTGSGTGVISFVAYVDATVAENLLEIDTSANIDVSFADIDAATEFGFGSGRQADSVRLTFDTIQELLDQVGSLTDSVSLVSAFDATTSELTFDVELSESSVPVLTPFTSNLALGSLSDINVTDSVLLQPDVALDFSYGTDLETIDESRLKPIGTIDQSGRLSGDATFDIVIDGVPSSFTSDSCFDQHQR